MLRRIALYVLRLVTLAGLLGAAACGQPAPPPGPNTTGSNDATPRSTDTTPRVATPTLTPVPSPTFTPSPTPPPAARITAADEALFAGDWPWAIAAYEQVLAQSTDADLRLAAYLGLGKAYLASGNPEAATRALAQVLERHPESPLTADAHFLLGEAFRALGLWAQSVEGYRQYQQRRGPAIDSYVEERLAQALSFAGDYAGAALAYQAASRAPRANEGEVFDLRARWAETLALTGDWPAAAAEYERQAQTDTNASRQARALVLAGDLYAAHGDTARAHERYLDAVNRFPQSAFTFQGLVKLVEAGAPVDDLARGLTNYYAQNYEPALAAFQRVLADETGTEAAASALYHIGLTYADLNRTAEAITTFQRFVAAYPTEPAWQAAYFQIAFLQPYPQDVQTFRDFARAVPAHPEAPDALYRAARLCERNGNLALAATLWTQIAQEYSTWERAADAAMQAGLVLYRAGDLASAAQRFELAAQVSAAAEETGRAWLWLGKVRVRQGNLPAARDAWAEAAARDPGAYYGLRAAQLLAEAAPFAPPAGFAFEYDAATEQALAERWLRETFPAASGLTELSPLAKGLWNEARFVRGAELWRLGLLREAHAEFDSLRRAVWADPVAMWQLALYWHGIGAYDLAIRSARQVLDLAGVRDLTAGPVYLHRLRFPAPFAALVTAASAEHGVHPFLMYSKMRIESFFWKYAFSSAQARGLNQIIPSTAEDIAGKLALPAFAQDDLYRPVVSIPMGAYYLAYVGRTTQGGAAQMLAGYYAGPGNAQAWEALADGDPDLFVEVIRLPDAKGYVQTTFEYFEMYRRLYGQQP